MKSCGWVSHIINEKCFMFDEFNHWIKSGKWRIIFCHYGWKWMFIMNFIHEQEIKCYQMFFKSMMDENLIFMDEIHPWKLNTNDRWNSYILVENKCSWMNIIHEQQTKLYEIL
jgi:hypothetical protein